MANMMPLLRSSDDCCVRCGHAGSDVRIKSCPNGCAYHARCIDLLAIERTCRSTPGTDGFASLATCRTCPHCSSPSADGLEMIPLSFEEVDAARRLAGYNDNDDRGSSSSAAATMGGKRRRGAGGGGLGENDSLCDDPTSSSSSSGSALQGHYDPASPRTGKWSDEEIAFRDSLVPHFVEGSLPLPAGLKLIDFLSGVLKSKPSRLTKKMKRAKLSTRHFRPDAGCVRCVDRAAEVSRLELAFVESISDAVERSEIRFHMRKEWRDRLAERLSLLRIAFDARAWLESADVVDGRIAASKSRNRMVRRRFMMGRAMEKDVVDAGPGVFIDRSGMMLGEQDMGGQQQLRHADLDLLASALGKDDAEDDDLRALCSSAAQVAHMATMMAQPVSHEVSFDDSARSHRGSVAVVPAATRASFGSVVSYERGATGGSEGSSRPSSAEPPAASSVPALPPAGCAEGPNFRFAAPFLAKIANYVERERVPFEHVDVWVPCGASDPVLDPTGAAAPEPSVLGSGSARDGGGNGDGDEGRGRLCFAGSASVGVQMVSDGPYGGFPSSHASPFDPRCSPGFHPVPLSSDEIYHLSLFGSYSEKYSFSSGCGLPGRVHASATPAWEQFVANAPSALFERRGGAMQFGIKTALGLPVRSPNVGRIVVVLYSRHNREKDDALVARMVRDFQGLNPCPRWKLMVDMGTLGSNCLSEQSQPGVALEAVTGRSSQIASLISLLGENMPSDQSTPLGQRLHDVMSLRLVLLRTNRSPHDEQLVDSIITLFESYVRAGRSRSDVALMLARDFAFHSKMSQQPQATDFRRQVSIPTMQRLSLGAMPGPPQHQQPQEAPSCQLDHTHHGRPCADPPSGENAMATDALSSLMGGNYPGPDLGVSPRSSSSLNRLESLNRGPSKEPPPSLPS